MSRAWIIVGVLAAVVAVTLACRCTPDQWEGTVGSVAPGHRTKFSSVNISYDATGERVALSEWMWSGGKPKTFKVIADFKKEKAYISWNEGKSCKTKTLKKKFHKFCAPEKGFSCLKKESHLGGGSDTLKVFNCFYKNESKEGKFKVEASMVATENCYPVSEAIYIEARRERKMFFSQFSDITEGIKDAKVFTPPKSCNATVLMEEFQERFENSIWLNI